MAQLIRLTLTLGNSFIAAPSKEGVRSLSEEIRGMPQNTLYVHSGKVHWSPEENKPILTELGKSLSSLGLVLLKYDEPLAIFFEALRDAGLKWALMREARSHFMPFSFLHTLS